MGFRRVCWVAAIAILLAVACKREESGEPLYPGPPPTGTMPGASPPPPAPAPVPQAPGPTTGQPPPTASPPAPTAAQPPPPIGGLPCATDNDLQCPFGRCLGGRCGGCRTDADCKAGAGCFTTPMGPSCMPRGQATAPPTPPPATAPPPTTAPPPATTPPPPAGDPHAAARKRCVDRINQYRATRGAAALSPRTDRVSCANSAAASDAASNKPHGAFGQCQESAQNECPGWQGSLDQVVDSCAKAMFDEGPGEGARPRPLPQHDGPGLPKCGLRHSRDSGRAQLDRAQLLPLNPLRARRPAFALGYRGDERF